MIATKLTLAQAEVIEELHRYGDSFLTHEVFTTRDNRDNGARRTMRGLIGRGLIVKTGYEDARGNPYYKLTPAALDAYQAWYAKEQDKQAEVYRQRRAAGIADDLDW